jgi:hypothetical protein
MQAFFPPDDGAPPGQEVQDVRRNARLAVDVMEPQTRPGGVLGRLEDHRVARHESRGGHAGRQRQGEVERRDAGEHPVGSQQIRIVLDRRELVHLLLEAVGVFHLPRVVVDQVGRLLGVAERLQAALSDLETHARRELELALANQLRRLAHDGHARLPAELLPPAARPVGGLDRPIHVLHGRGGELAQDEIDVDG